MVHTVTSRAGWYWAYDEKLLLADTSLKSSAQGLTYLQLNFMTTDDDDFAFLATFPELRLPGFEGIYAVTDSLMSAVLAAPKLDYLRFVTDSPYWKEFTSTFGLLSAEAATLRPALRIHFGGPADIYTLTDDAEAEAV